MLPLPAEGRVYTGERRVRLGDATADRRLRLDAVARYLQDVAEDDAAEAGLSDAVGWVLRRTRLEVRKFPVLGEELTLATFCSAIAGRWAERTTTITGHDGGLLQATSVWVAVDRTTGAPARLDERFAAVYGAAAGGRRASARLVLGPPTEPSLAGGRPWPLRRADVDVWGHVNNAVSWAAVEDAADVGRWLPLCAELEHVAPIAPDDQPRLVARSTEAGDEVWLVDGSLAGDEGGGRHDTGADSGSSAGSGSGAGVGAFGVDGARVLTAARLRPLGEG